MNEKEQIIDWLIANYSAVQNIIFYLNEEREIMVRTEPDFFEEINAQYSERVKALVGEEISRQLGMQIDIIFEVLETPEIQEYFIQ